MTDPIADITTLLAELKKRDGWTDITVQDFDKTSMTDAGCTVKVWDRKNYGGAHAKNFGIAYANAVKRLREGKK